MKKLNRNNILKGAGVLLMAAVLIFSTLPATANTNESSEFMLAGADYISQPQQTNTFDPDWIHFDDGTNVNSIGLTNGGTFEFGIRITPAELAGYDGWPLTTVKWHHGMAGNPQPSHSGTIKIYDAGTSSSPGALLTSEAFTTAASSDWEETTLSNPVIIDASKDIWVTIRVTHAAAEFPAGVGPGPMVRGKGGWITTDSVTWEQIGDLGLDYNWNLWAGVGISTPEPDLDCDGVLNWADVEPGSTVTGEFTVENIGDPESLLDWEIESYPEWGNWTFTPSSGTDLTPEDGVITIDVEVVAPDEGEEFTGEVKIVNSGDPDDFCIIDATMTDQVSRHPSLILQFMEMLAERFPILAMVLEAVL